MMEKRKTNYSRELDDIIEKNSRDGVRPTLLIHGCCAPCSSSVISFLSRHFKITELFYNPNIFPEEEYRLREDELVRMIDQMKSDGTISRDVNVIRDYYDPDEFFKIAKGLEDVPEGGERCSRCYRQRMERAAAIASEGGFDYFCTTLSLSPLKDAEKINRIGRELEASYGVRFLPSDFKKKDGYRRSVELSKKYDLYRQNYCGCVFSKAGR